MSLCLSEKADTLQIKLFALPELWEFWTYILNFWGRKWCMLQFSSIIFSSFPGSNRLTYVGTNVLEVGNTLCQPKTLVEQVSLDFFRPFFVRLCDQCTCLSAPASHFWTLPLSVIAKLCSGIFQEKCFVNSPILWLSPHFLHHKH